MPERGDLLLAEGSPGGDRTMEGTVQHGAAAFGAGLQAAGTTSNLAETTGGMGMWKTLRVSHIPTPPAATTDKCPTRRYTNTPLGTKDRSGHLVASRTGCTGSSLWFAALQKSAARDHA